MRNCGRAAHCIQTDAAVMGLAALAGIAQTCDSVFALHKVCGMIVQQPELSHDQYRVIRPPRHTG